MREDDQSRASHRFEFMFRLAVVSGVLASAGLIILSLVAEVHFIVKFW